MRYAGQNFIYPVAKSHGNRHTTFPKDAAVIHVDIFTQSEGGQLSDQAVSQPPSGIGAGGAGAGSADIDTDVSVCDFEGYLDMLAYVNRKLPITPGPPQSISRDASLSPSLSISCPPKEDEWISSRPPSRTSTVFSHNDEVRRVRTHSGLLSRNSPAGRTVTPMSSLGSEGLRISTRASLHTSVVTSRIDELSEPETPKSPCVTTPKRDATPPPKQCCHCGRDPDKRDCTDADSGPLTAVKTQDATNINSSPLTVINIKKHEKDWESKMTGPTITAEDALGRHFVLYAETSYFIALDGSRKGLSESSAAQTPPSADISPSSPQTPSPYARPLNPDPYADENSPSKRVISPYQRPSNPEPSTASSSHSDPDQVTPDKDMDEGRDSSDKEGEPTFWKDPAGTIVVYDGIARDGDEVFYGSDINYLGSFYDADEGSSGLGSAVDLMGLSSGLHVIHEDRSSEDLAMWDKDVLTFR
ncbi:hypothetical protein F5883DRAFT_680026 [Diaporthe sp. PMI_573]|nr:hypothetical protein F5883DRAFT_680026 [Diaporthaceae sp. PMI_573]